MRHIRGQNIPICIFHDDVADSTGSVDAIKSALSLKQDYIQDIMTIDVSDRDYVKHINDFYKRYSRCNRLIIIYPTSNRPEVIDSLIPNISSKIFVIYTHSPYINRVLDHGISLSHSVSSLSTAILTWINYNHYKHVVNVGDHVINTDLREYRERDVFTGRYYNFTASVRTSKSINKLTGSILVLVHLDRLDIKDFINSITIPCDIIILDMYYRLRIDSDIKKIYYITNNLYQSISHNELYNNNDQYALVTATSRDAGLLAARISELMIPATGQSVLVHLDRLMNDNYWYYLKEQEYYRYDLMLLNPDDDQVLPFDDTVIMFNDRSIKIYSIVIDKSIRLIPEKIVTYEVNGTEYKKYTSSTLIDDQIYIGPTNLEHSPIILYDKNKRIRRIKFHTMDFTEESIVID